MYELPIHKNENKGCENINIFITGASRGIGKAITLAFADATQIEKSTFFITYNKNQKEAFDLNNYLVHIGHHVIPIKLDVTDRTRIEEVVKYLSEEYELKIDVLVNNAGITQDRTLRKMSNEEWDNVINVNLTGMFNVTKALLPFMNDGGSIINITSIIGIMGAFGQANYAASKAGVIGFTKALAKEVAKNNIRVNAIACGFVDTDMTKTIPDDIKKQIMDKILLKRFARPEEIASFVVFLAMKGTFCTGQVYVVDGGMS
jgi:NAD(P)-dependent dehydrogenase (short-subunit alcohol dehydrogenase family)